MDRFCTIVPAALLAGCAGIAMSLAATPAAAGCNSGNVANNSLLSNSACQANASGNSATAVGESAIATGGSSSAFGAGATATGFASSAFGNSASALGTRSTAVGLFAGLSSGTADGYTALGTHAGQGHILGAYSITVGGSDNNILNPRATGDYSIAIGGGDNFSGNPGAIAGGPDRNDFTIAIGSGAEAGAISGGQSGAVAVGRGARANAVAAAAYGQDSRAIGNNSAAYGRQSRAEGNNSAAYGRQSRAEGKSSVAIGQKSLASARSSVAIGQGSVANRVDTVSVGSGNLKRRVVHVAPAVAGTDATNLTQVKALIKAATTASGSASAVPPADEDIRRELAELRELVIRQQQRIAELEARSTLAALAD